MAQPMSHVQFVELLDEWHIPHRRNDVGRSEVWYQHNRNHKGEWGPVNGIGNHHTGGNDDKAGANVLWGGYADLPGPLCHAGIQQDGYVLLNGWGRVNHFGLGDSTVLKHVINEDYSGRLKPTKADIDGNSHFYGFEWMYDGKHDPKAAYPKLYYTAVRLNAAINTYHNWKPFSSIAHGEWQPGKWDPGYKSGQLFDVVAFRSDIEQAMEEGPNPKPVSKFKNITVLNGDTFTSLAKKFYPKLPVMDAVFELVKNNPNLLKAGMTLRVPR